MMCANILYKRRVVADHKNCEVMQATIDNVLDHATELYGDEIVDLVGTVDIAYYDKGMDAAQAAYLKVNGESHSILQFSMELVKREIKKMRREIVPHEVAHLICMSNRWDDGHGETWRSVCRSLGGNGETLHSMRVTDGRRSYVHEAISDSGSLHWLTKKQYKMAASSGIIVRDNVTGVNLSLTKNNLTGKIIKL